MLFKFEKLLVWQLSMDLGEDINVLIKSYPENERYNLISQSLRAADSIALNIAEGSIGQSVAEQKKFVGYSIRSLAELITCLHKAKRRMYVTEEDFKNNYRKAFELMNRLIAFRNNVR